MFVFLFFIAGVFLPTVQGRLKNVALLKPTHLSTTILGFDKSNGVDGNTFTKVETVTALNSWFVVDLLKDYKVQYTLLFSIELEDPDLKKFIVGLARSFDRNSNPPVRGQYELCGQWSGEVYAPNVPMRVNCNEAAAKARYVILQNPLDTQWVEFKEMEVYAESFDFDNQQLGCYEEMSDDYTKFENVTNVVDCLTICERNQTSFSLIKSASECFCSDELPKISSSLSQCSLSCSEDGYPCGGPQYYSVYQAEPVEKAQKKYLGCYIDEAFRELPFRFKYETEMTIELCLKWCLTNGYPYAALQSSSECNCGHTYGRYGAGVGCNQNCTGDSCQLCGGKLMNSIFEATNFTEFTPVCKKGQSSCDTICQDIDECFTQTDICQRNTTTCINNEGSYTCNCSLEGYENENIYNCIDIDECARNTSNCEQNTTTCNNNEGSYTCNCSLGGYEKKDNYTCIDIDECARKTDNCDRNVTTCINNEGSYTCDCSLGGYEKKDNYTCIDINECVRNIDNCDPNTSTCINNAGSYFCNCSLGGYENKDNKTCTDIDECAIKTNTCDRNLATCINNEGSYVCNCSADGYENKNSSACIDIDECARNTDKCERDITICTNYAGSYTCNCSLGGYEKKDNYTCIDIDECARKTDNCDRNVTTCINNAGSYTCKSIPQVDAQGILILGLVGSFVAIVIIILHVCFFVRFIKSF